MLKKKKVLAAILGLLTCMASAAQAAVIDQVVGAVAPEGGAQLVKRFHVAAGSVIVGIEFVSNDLRTVFPKVAVLQGAATRTGEAQVLHEVSGVHVGLRHRIRLGIPSISVSEDQDVYVAVTLPASNGVRGVKDGPGLGATNTGEQNGSYIASAPDGTLQAIDVDLAIGLVFRSVGKATADGEAPADEIKAPAVTFFSGGSPNPASSIAQVRFGLDSRRTVKLAIYNVAGRLVRLLAEGPMDAGVHSVRWDGRNEQGQELAAGVYIAKLQAGDKVMTQKLVLAR